MANLLTWLFWHLPALLLVGEVVATVVLSRRRTSHRLLYILGSYLVLVALAVAFAFAMAGNGEDMGYGTIPALMLTAPWYFIPGLAIPLTIVVMPLGAALNCALFFVIDRLSYPKHSATVSGLNAT